MLMVTPQRFHSVEDRKMPELIPFGITPGESLELAFVFLTIMGSLAIMVLLGAWWQR